MRGRGVCAGIAEGVALVCPDSVQGAGGVDERTGVIIEKGHINQGKTIKDTILIVPGSRGSNYWATHFIVTRLTGCSPRGWVVTNMDSRVAVALTVLGAPAVTELDLDPFALIETGDVVRVDGDRGTVQVLRREPDRPT